jgi:uncharacterized damage-inducible protein DinB
MAERAGIAALRYLLDEAFAGRGLEASNESQALLTNLATVGEADWRRLPAGAARSIEAMVLHLGSTKLMYDDYAFGEGRRRWSDPEVTPWRPDAAPMTDALDWLANVHAELLRHVDALADDAELDRLRHTAWGDWRPTRWILAALVTHDAYHAGEINHLRSLLGHDDRWRHEQLGWFG